MFLRVATFIAAASATATIGSAAPDAQADPQTQDQQFLNMVRSNNVGGQDDTLIKYAHEFCTMTTFTLPSRPDLYGQGLLPVGLYIVRVAASHVYCPER
jgi:Protein of unknown function (DUF732)